MPSTPIGARFGRLVVIADGPRRLEPCGVWTQLVRVRCDCGTEQLVRVPNLRSGNSRSCGCLARALAAARRAARRGDVHEHAPG